MSYGTYCGKCSEYTANYTTRRDDEGTPMIVCVECPMDRVSRICRENEQLRTQLSESQSRMKAILAAIQEHAEGGNIENYRYLSDKLEALAATAEKE